MVYYVYSKCTTTRACIHLGRHDHPYKIGDYRALKDQVSTLIRDQLDKTPKATRSSIVLEAAKALIGGMLLRDEHEAFRIFTFDKLAHILDQCKDLGCPISEIV